MTGLVGRMVACAAFMGGLTVAAHATDLTIHSFYATPIERDFYQGVAKTFEAQNPGVTVRHEFIDFTAYDAALRTAFASGQIPDLIAVEPDGRAVGMYPLLKADQLADLSELYKQESWQEKLFPSVIKQLSVDGHFYSVPVSTNNFSLFYNKNILKKYGLKPPESFGDLKKMKEALSKDGIYPVTFGNRFPQRGRDYFYMLVGQLGADLIPQADRGTIPFTDPRFVAAAQKLKDMVDEGIFMPGANGMNGDEERDNFLLGRAATVLQGPWMINAFNAQKPEGFEYGVVRFPAVMDGGTPVSPGGVGQNFAVPKAGKNQDIAKKFLALLLSEEVQEQFVQTIGESAPYAAPNAKSKEEHLVAFHKYQETAVVPRVMVNAKLVEALGNAIQGLLAGELTAEQAMEEVEDAR